jgi:hypothetical protein
MAEGEIAADPRKAEVLFPFLIFTDLIARRSSLPGRYVIDFHPHDQLTAQTYRSLFEHVRRIVLPVRQRAADKEAKRNDDARKANLLAKINHHHANFLNKWWLLSYPREEMIAAIEKLSRYIVCGQVTKRQIFEFVSSKIRPNASLIIFPFEDNYSFGILQSSIHWLWFINKCSTLTGRHRYTSNTVFDTFPWPQAPSLHAIGSVAKAGQRLWRLRRDLMDQHQLSLRTLYRSLERPGHHPLKEAQASLDRGYAALFNRSSAGSA